MRASLGLALLGLAVVLFWLWLEPATESARLSGIDAARSSAPADRQPSRPPADSVSPLRVPLLMPPIQQQQAVVVPLAEPLEIDYVHGVRGEDLPPEVLERVHALYIESARGNYDHTAHIALDLLEQAEKYPQYRPMLHGTVGYAYEKLGYMDMAIEQYRHALAIFPQHRLSYMGLRRLDAEFARDNEPLPSPVRPPGKSAPQAEPAAAE